jgi:transposase
VEDFRSQIDVKGKFKWVADSALYTKERLLKNNDYVWVTRVPETITEARNLIEKTDGEISWVERGEGYKTAGYQSSYGGIEQRWLLVFSEQAYQREKKTLEKKLEREGEKLQKALWHFGNQKFHCEQDALKALEEIRKGYKLHIIEAQVEPLSKHTGRGKPKNDATKIVVGYKVNTTFTKNTTKISDLLNKKGRFILSTNELDREGYKDDQILEEYKEQQSVEGGFRFLKDPWFMVDSIFLKLPKRIEALMMVMTLCLMIYNVGQYKLREQLKAHQTSLPNQLGKEVSNPTLKWIFQMMEGIDMVYFYNESLTHTIREVVTNLNGLRKKIIGLFGKSAAYIYGIIHENWAEGLKM